MLTQSAIDGYKVCIFAYGQTGSGKTFSMFGSDAVLRDPADDVHASSRGLVLRAAAALLDGLAGGDVSVSFLEVYNDRLHDLLGGATGPAGTRPSLPLREAAASGVCVEGLSRRQVSSIAEVA